MALSIQKKFRWEISEILTAQWNSTFEFRLHRPGTQATARLVIVLVNRIQKSGAGVNNFVKWKGRFRSDRPEMKRHGKKGLPWKHRPGTQATARLVIVLVNRIQKSGAGVNNFVKWKGRFRSDRPEMKRHGKKGLPWKLVPNIPVGPSRNGLFHLIGTNWNFRNFGLNGKRANTTEHLWGNKECAESAWPANQAGSPHDKARA